MKSGVILLTAIAVVVRAVTHGQSESDPSVPDETDRDVIDDYLNSRAEVLKHPETTSKPEDSSSTPPPPQENLQHTESGEPCKCVKYYSCRVDANATNANGTLQGVVEEEENGDDQEGSEIAGLVDIRNGGIKSKNGSEAAGPTNSSAPECQHYFDVCCELKNVKETKKEQDGDKKEDPHPPPPKDTKTFEHTTCGHRNENGVGFKMTGGTNGEAQFGEFPWTVALINLEENEDKALINKYIGGGSLIHPEVILTVAHNVLGKNRSTLRVRLGEWDTQTNEEPYPSQDRGVAKVIIHEQYNKKRMFNDIALLILEEEARIAPNVDTVCLPPLNRKLNFVGQICYSSGWGKDQFGAQGRYSEIMKRVSVPIISKKDCQEILGKSERLPGFRLDKTFLCAGGTETGEDTCKGDGGSALVCSLPGKHHKHYVQVGIVSWGLGCKSTIYPGVYTDVLALTPWILKKMEEEGKSTDYCALRD